MRRIVCNEVGPLSNGMDGLVIEDAPDLVPGPNQVVIDVKGCGVTFVDSLFVRGGYQIKPPTPFTPGSEVAGVVIAVGENVTGVGIGDRVITSCGLGGYAEQVITGPNAIYPLPDAISFEVGATLIQSYATSMFALTRRTTVSEGEWVLVLGAGGGVGLSCIDVARHLGARSIGVASSESKRQLALEAGAEAVIDPSTEDVKTRAREISGGGVDVVYDAIGGPLAEPSLRALRTFGRYLVIGFASGEIPRLPLNQMLLNNRQVIGVDWGGWVGPHVTENQEMVREIIALTADGSLHPVEPQTVPLSKAGDVLRDIEERRLTGKVVLVP